MSLATALVIEPTIDLQVFVPACEHLTSTNPVRPVDANPGQSRLHDQSRILDNFTESGLTPVLLHVGFLVAGPTYQVNEFLELTGGLPHIAARGVRPDARAIIVVGSLLDWKAAIIHGCGASDSYLCNTFFNLLDTLKKRGFGDLFDEYKVVPQPSGVPLLLLK